MHLSNVTRLRSSIVAAIVRIRFLLLILIATSVGSVVVVVSPRSVVVRIRILLSIRVVAIVRTCVLRLLIVVVALLISLWSLSAVPPLLLAAIQFLDFAQSLLFLQALPLDRIGL